LPGILVGEKIPKAGITKFWEKDGRAEWVEIYRKGGSSRQSKKGGGKGRVFGQKGILSEKKS